jgi:hypothetical protein
MRAFSKKYGRLVAALLEVNIQNPHECRAWRGIFRVRTRGDGYPGGILPVAEGKYAARLR